MTKYHATKIRVDGYTFASKGEARRWAELNLLERSGKISRLERQPVFRLILPNGVPVLTPKGRVAKYTADFAYFEGNNRVIEDFKGFDTPEGKLRRSVAEAIYGIKVIIVR